MSERPVAHADVRRWQPPEVSGTGSTVARSSPGPQAHGSMLTAERVAEIEDHARKEGHERGLAEGRKAAEREWAAQKKRFDQLFANIHPQSAILDDALLEQLGELVLAVARQFIRRELKREPGEVVRVVREAIRALPAVEATIRVHVHPDDAALLQFEPGVEGSERPIRIIEDVTVTRGGARVETDVSSVDATIETRLNAIAANLFGDERSSADAAGERRGD